jgi:hypothetical protein
MIDLSLKDNRPISSFNFYVGLEGSAVFDSFQSVSGIGASMEMEKMDDLGMEIKCILSLDKLNMSLWFLRKVC